MLRNADEEDLRWFWARGLSTDAGMRSTIGGMLENMRLKLPPSGGGMVDPYENHGRLVHGVERDRRVRMTLERCEAWQVETLGVAYGPIPQQVVWGLGALGSREGAALAVSLQAIDAPGASQWQAVADLVKRADNGSAKAKTEVRELRAFVERALFQSRNAYRRASKCVRQDLRGKRQQLTEDILDMICELQS